MKNRSSVVAVFTCYLFLTVSSFAQPVGYVEIPSETSAFQRSIGCVQLKDGSYELDAIKKLSSFESCRKDLPSVDLDLESRTLFRWSAGSDCNMRVKLKVFRVDAEKKYKVIINNIYGGCRAGGRRSGWVTFEKLPQGYSVEMVEVRIDRIHSGDRDDAFKFPSPPPTVHRERIDVSEIDLKGCLPMSGQSQWVINSETVLTAALNESTERLRCNDHLRYLGLDLKKAVLVGYSFASGHCERPPGLSFEATSETSDDPRANRYVVNAHFDSAVNAPCPTWKTYNVWLVMPKLPAGFAIDLQATQRK